MTNTPSSAQRARSLSILQFFVPVTTLCLAAVLWFVLSEPLNDYVMGGLLILATGEFFMLRSYASKMVRQAERDRG